MKNQVNIFIVDDDKLFSLALKIDLEKAFEDLSIIVHSFETGEKCIEKFKEEKPEVVILDYHLNSKYPDALDGIKVLDWIKKENNDTHVIILTGEDNVDVALKSFHHGASDYVVKSETHFRKINYSLLNLFKMLEAKSYEKRYNNLIIGIFICVAMIVGGALAMKYLTH